MFLNGTRRIATTFTENLSLLLTIVANIIIPIANAYSIYTYWKPVYAVYIVVPLLMLDAVYRVALIKWYIHGVASDDVRDSESVQLPIEEHPPPVAIEENAPLAAIEKNAPPTVFEEKAPPATTCISHISIEESVQPASGESLLVFEKRSVANLNIKHLAVETYLVFHRNEEKTNTIKLNTLTEASPSPELVSHEYK